MNLAKLCLFIQQTHELSLVKMFKYSIFLLGRITQILASHLVYRLVQVQLSYK